jgi:hypothetical protein
VSASLPEHTRSTGQKNDAVTSSKPSTKHSELQFGFSTELENLVILTMKEDKDV